MQLDRQLKSDKELNASVELVKELSAGEFDISQVRVTLTNMFNNDTWNPKINTLATWYGSSFIGEVSATRKTVTISNFRPAQIEHPLMDTSNGQVRQIVKVIEKWNGVHHTRFDKLAEDVEKYCRKVFKINKNDVMTMPNFLRMIAFINGFEIQEKHLKEALNAIAGTAERVYLYKTQKYIAEHYARLEEKADLSSCHSSMVVADILQSIAHRTMTRSVVNFMWRLWLIGQVKILTQTTCRMDLKKEKCSN